MATLSTASSDPAADYNPRHGSYCLYCFIFFLSHQIPLVPGHLRVLCTSKLFRFQYSLYVQLISCLNLRLHCRLVVDCVTVTGSPGWNCGYCLWYLFYLDSPLLFLIARSRSRSQSRSPFPFSVRSSLGHNQGKRND